MYNKNVYRIDVIFFEEIEKVTMSRSCFVVATAFSKAIKEVEDYYKDSLISLSAEAYDTDMIVVTEGTAEVITSELT